MVETAATAIHVLEDAGAKTRSDPAEGVIFAWTGHGRPPTYYITVKLETLTPKETKVRVDVRCKTRSGESDPGYEDKTARDVLWAMTRQFAGFQPELVLLTPEGTLPSRD